MYGEPSFGPGCGDCRSSRNVATGLGFDPTPYLEAGVQVLKEFGSSTSSSTSSGVASPVPTGGGISRSGCSMWPLDWVAATLKQMTAAQLSALQTSLSNSHVAGASVYDPASVQYWCAGGSDCNTGSAHPDVVAFNKMVWQVGQTMGTPTLASAPTTYPIDLGPLTFPFPLDPFAKGYPATSTPADQSTLDKILALLGKAASTGLTAAENTVLQTGYQTLSPTQQAQLQRSIAPSLLKQYEVPLMIGGGLLVVLLLTRK